MSCEHRWTKDAAACDHCGTSISEALAPPPEKKAPKPRCQFRLWRGKTFHECGRVLSGSGNLCRIHAEAASLACEWPYGSGQTCRRVKQPGSSFCPLHQRPAAPSRGKTKRVTLTFEFDTLSDGETLLEAENVMICALEDVAHALNIDVGLEVEVEKEPEDRLMQDVRAAQSLVDDRPECPSCKTAFDNEYQLRRHVRTAGYPCDPYGNVDR